MTNSYPVKWILTKKEEKSDAVADITTTPKRVSNASSDRSVQDRIIASLDLRS